MQVCICASDTEPSRLETFLIITMCGAFILFILILQSFLVLGQADRNLTTTIDKETIKGRTLRVCVYHVQPIGFIAFPS